MRGWGNCYKCRWSFKAKESLTLVTRLLRSSSNLNCSHKSHYMTSSDSSSDTTVSPSSSSSSSSPNQSPSLSQFDPFAVHPFTRYVSSNPSGNAPTANSYAYPYRQLLGAHPTPHAPIPNRQSPPKPYVYTVPHHTGIFVPFRKETSSPDLPAILKPKSDSSSATPATTSKSRPT
jgi:hypothetical protein